VDYARTLGEVSHLEVQDLDRQCGEAALPAGKPAVQGETAVVCLVEGDGLAEVFRSLGAVTIQQDIPGALEGVSVRQILLVPTSEGALAAARRARGPAGSTVRVVPARNVPQGLAALMAFRFDLDVEKNAAAMTNALGGVRTVEVQADAPDPLLALERSLRAAGADPAEVVTIYHGSGAAPSLAEGAAAACRRVFPGARVELVNGGQRRPLLIVSLE
jgi:hypothetical protein